MSGPEYDPYLDVLETLSEYQHKLEGDRTYLSYVATDFFDAPVVKIRAEVWKDDDRITAEQNIFLDTINQNRLPPSELIERKIQGIVKQVNQHA